MSFAFRLAPVLRYRKRTEDSRASVLAVAVRSHAAAAERQAALVHEIAACRDAIRIAGARSATGFEIQCLDEAATAATNEAAAAAAELTHTGARVEAAREDLMRASRDRRSLERLQEMKRVEYAQLRTDAERALLDELGGVRDPARRAAAQREASR